MSDIHLTDDYIRQFLEADLPIKNYFVYESHKIGGPVVHCVGPNGKASIMCIHDSRLLNACVDYLKRMKMPVLHTLDEVDVYVASWPKPTHTSP